MIAKSLALASVLAVSAATAQAAPIYATSVVSFTQGSVEKVVAGRSDPTKALGANDGGFVSLGFGGELVLGFSQPFRAIGQVFEITFNDPRRHRESADLFVGNGGAWTFVGSLQNTLSLAFNAAGTFTQLRLVDTSNASGATFDGFDVDAVSVSPVPVPAAGLLLGGALVGLGALRRRKRG
jgi:hypothetical protein